MIQHVTLAVPDEVLPACRKFWRLLGFEPVEPPESLRDQAEWLQKGRQQVHLLRAPDGRPGRGGSHVALEVGRDRYEETLERLRAAGFEIDRRREHWGSPRCFVHDPAGYRVELMAWAPT